MALIGYSTSSAFGSKVAGVVQDLRNAQAVLARTKGVMDDLTAGGTIPVALESSTLFSVATGQGANFYNAVVAMNVAIATLQAITDLDQG
jgi:7,8-dihydro-6-hydroxymethylpterin-pyrophosphokinase